MFKYTFVRVIQTIQTPAILMNDERNVDLIADEVEEEENAEVEAGGSEREKNGELSEFPICKVHSSVQTDRQKVGGK